MLTVMNNYVYTITVTQQNPGSFVIYTCTCMATSVTCAPYEFLHV